MKKFLVAMLTLLLVSVTACSSGTGTTSGDSSKNLGSLTVGFVPSKEADVILEAAEPMKEWLKTKLEEKGYTVDEVNLTVGTDFTVVGEGMISGSIDIGFLNTNAYTQYQPNGVELVVEALRNGVADDQGNIFPDNQDYKQYNCAFTQDATEKVSGYPGLIYVNIDTEKGADLYAKVEAGTLTWDDINSATWHTSSVTSASGYIYPSLWIDNQFGSGVGNKITTIADLSNVVSDQSYANMMTALITGQADVIVGYSDIRKDEASTTDFEAAYKEEIAAGKYKTVWDIIKIIGVSPYIMNDTVSMSSNENAFNGNYSEQLKADLQDIFVNMTEEELAMVKPYSHAGYQVGSDSDYDAARKASEIFK